MSLCQVGLQYLAGDISGGNARCIAILPAFKEAIEDYSTPQEKTLARGLTAKISSYVSFFIECRPLSIGMGNAIRFLKTRIFTKHTPKPNPLEWKPCATGYDKVRASSLAGDPDAIAKVSGRTDVNYLNNWASKENLQLLNLMYDATPSDCISMIVTDYGMIPPTSVPVIAREYRRDHMFI